MALTCGRILEDSIYYAPMIAVVCAVIATVIMIARLIFIPIANTEDIHLGETVAFLHEQRGHATDVPIEHHDFLSKLSEQIEREDVHKVDGILMQLTLASVGSCTCSTKSPDPKYHMVGCRYRALAEAHDLISKAYGRPMWPHASPNEGEEIYQQGGEPPIATS